jgi:hypothetical protein
MKINVDSDGSIGEQMFDCLQAYYQGICKNETYQSAHTIVFNQYSADNNINILLIDMPYPIKDGRPPVEYDKYDLILFCNGIENYGVGTDVIRDNLLVRDNAYLLTQSRVPHDHPLYHKIIWFSSLNMLPNHRLEQINYFYPYPYFYKKPSHENLMIFINGGNRTWRQHIVNKIQAVVPALPVRSNISALPYDTADAYFESAEDTEFREHVNELILHGIAPDFVENFYDRSVLTGLGGKFGKVPLGYFAMPEYSQYRCIIFPETSWLNNDFMMTEKILKCFIYENIPWPVGGANVNKQYNELGYTTAWNLLPEQHRTFDSIVDHEQRYVKLAEAVAWAWNHPEIFEGAQIKQITRDNFETIMRFTVGVSIMENIDRIIHEHSR